MDEAGADAEATATEKVGPAAGTSVARPAARRPAARASRQRTSGAKVRQQRALLVVLEGRLQARTSPLTGEVVWEGSEPGAAPGKEELDWLLGKAYVSLSPGMTVDGRRSVSVTSDGIRFYSNGG